MADYQVRIRGGEVYLHGTTLATDVLIDGGRIVALLSPDERGEAVTDVDASGMLVLPGIIDTHAHTREPGYEYKEDFWTASRAAAVGGITTMVDMPNVEPPTTRVRMLEEKRTVAQTKSLIDWGHWVAPTELDQIAALAEAGATGFKLFQVSGAYPHDPRLAVNDDGQLLKVMRSVATTGLPLLIHPFNQSLFEQLSQDAFDRGEPPNWLTFSKVYTSEPIWHTAVNTLLALQDLSKVRMHLLHTHSAGSLRLIRAAKEHGQTVTASIDPKYYHLTVEDLRRLRGRACPGGFVADDERRMEEIWCSLNDGNIDVIDSDHAPHTLKDLEELDHNAWQSAMGSPQYDWQYSMILTDVSKGKLSLQRAVELLCEGPARLLGIYPRKGVLLPGSDADLVIVDRNRRHVITDDDLYTKVQWSPYLGTEVCGVVTLTMLRGAVIARDRQILGEAGYGRYITGSPQ